MRLFSFLRKKMNPLPSNNPLPLVEIDATQFSAADTLFTGQAFEENTLSTAKKNSKKIKKDDDRNKEVTHILNQFKCVLKNSSDPSLEILKVHLQHAESLMGDQISPRIYPTRFDLLVQRTGQDFMQVKVNIIESVQYGYGALYCTIRTALDVYQMAISKQAKKAISDITTLATDLLVMAKTSTDQYKHYKTTLDHLGVTWNATANSMSSYMESVDKKILEMSVPKDTKYIPRSNPTTVSQSGAPDVAMLLKEFLIGRTYRSQHGTLIVDATGKTCFTPSTVAGQKLSLITNTTIKGGTLYSLLTIEHQYLFDDLKLKLLDYSDLTLTEKKDLINDIRENAPRDHSLWVQV